LQVLQQIYFDASRTEVNKTHKLTQAKSLKLRTVGIVFW